MSRRLLLSVAALAVIGLSSVGPAAAAGAAQSGTYAQWQPASAPVTLTFPGSSFPSGTISSDSSTQLRTLSQDLMAKATVFGKHFGASTAKGAPLPYVSLSSRADGQESTTTITFAKPALATSWGFALGDVDLEQVSIAATAPDGRAIDVSSWFQSVFNACRAAGNSCSDNSTSALPGWDGSQGALVGDASPNSGASAWFIPTEPVASLSLLVKDLSAVRGDTVELWIATTAPPARPASRADSHPLAPTGVNGWLVVAGLAFVLVGFGLFMVAREPGDVPEVTDVAELADVADVAELAELAASPQAALSLVARGASWWPALTSTQIGYRRNALYARYTENSPAATPASPSSRPPSEPTLSNCRPKTALTRASTRPTTRKGTFAEPDSHTPTAPPPTIRTKITTTKSASDSMAQHLSTSRVALHRARLGAHRAPSCSVRQQPGIKSGHIPPPACLVSYSSLLTADRKPAGAESATVVVGKPHSLRTEPRARNTCGLFRGLQHPTIYTSELTDT